MFKKWEVVKKLEEMNWSVLAEKINSETVAILPIGSIEQHGFGPLGTDYSIAKRMADRVAIELPNSILIPALPYGMSFHHTAYPGTISFNNVSEFQAVVETIFRNLYRSGFRRIFVVNGHGGNYLGINQAIKSVQVFLKDLKILNTAMDYVDGTTPELSEANRVIAEICAATGEKELSHADAAEFSLLFALFPQTREMMDPELERFPAIPDLTTVSGVRDPGEWKERMAPGKGGKGDPRKARPDLGILFIKAWGKQLVQDATTKW